MRLEGRDFSAYVLPICLSVALLMPVLLGGAAAAEIVHACIVKKGMLLVVENPLICDQKGASTISWEVEDTTAPPPPRFEDCGDGTVADRWSGLQWEKKAGALETPIPCDANDCSDPNEVDNTYSWTETGTDQDGGAFLAFLARLNGEFDPFAATGCFAGHCDWKLPKISELQTILIGRDAAPGQNSSCEAVPCIDPDLAAVGGPTAPAFYWSASDQTLDRPSSTAWLADFGVGDRTGIGGFVSPLLSKSASIHARAVRTGSCD